MPSATQELPDFQGAVIEGGLRLIDCLGAGTWGKVYRAIDMLSPSDKPAYFAVKCMLKPEPESFEAQLQTREFTNHEYVSDHPNIVTFHRCFSDDRFTYVVLDLCTGGDLFQAIVTRGHFFQRTDRIKIAFLQILNAVHHCHQRGVFHRDLKPENILYSAEGEEYFVADFGLSTISTISMDFRCGSWEYMSPECIGKDFIFGKQYSTRTNDVWALGVILVNMITKRAPWTRARLNDPAFLRS
ncbi:kinase-like protein [Hymenopellis radicata]|nr:kinase-like protein [Hymenopellis radicata]